MKKLKMCKFIGLKKFFSSSKSLPVKWHYITKYKNFERLLSKLIEKDEAAGSMKNLLMHNHHLEILLTNTNATIASFLAENFLTCYQNEKSHYESGKILQVIIEGGSKK